MSFVIVGIDEVGYGPRLGPLIVSSCAFEVKDKDVKLWKELKPLVSRDTSRDSIVVNDSKLVFNQKKGIGSLEATVLSFLGQISRLNNVTFTKLAHKLAPCFNPSRYPWYQYDKTLPWVSDISRINDYSKRLGQLLARRQIRFLDVKSRILETLDFNAALLNEGNKHNIVFGIVLDIIALYTSQFKDKQLIVRIGKLGGRKFYLTQLSQTFQCPVSIVEESHNISRYRLYKDSNIIDISFILDGDRKDFAIALSSMIGKYVRECCMVFFNNFWQQKINGIPRTTGYGSDALRFFSEVQKKSSLANIPVQALLRNR